MPAKKTALSSRTANAARSGASAPPSRTERGALSPADWINAATELLVDRSIDAVRVDVLAKILLVTRGSFYWHFSDREDLLQQVLSNWREAQTEEIIARYRRRAAHPETIVQELAELPLHGRSARAGSSVELAIRAWARRDEMARLAVEQVDAKRLEYIQGCFTHLGYSEHAAQSRAFMLYAYMLGEALLRNQGTPEDKVMRRRFVMEAVLSQEGPGITPIA